jgi:hypothetical protein
MTVKDVKEVCVAETPWSAIPGPEYYDPGSVRNAFERLLDPASSARDAAAGLRRAVGNDHAGTLYPAAVMATGELIKLIEANPGRRREIAISVLLDWWGMFQAEPGYEVFVDSDRETVELIPAIIELVESARPVIADVAISDPVAAKKAELLLKCLDTGWVALDY